MRHNDTQVCGVLRVSLETEDYAYSLQENISLSRSRLVSLLVAVGSHNPSAPLTRGPHSLAFIMMTGRRW